MRDDIAGGQPAGVERLELRAQLGAPERVGDVADQLGIFVRVMFHS
jgi:hypothetical protein